MDVNGTLRPYAPPQISYVGADIAPGPGVTLVLADPHRVPITEGIFHIAVSTSCLEHDDMFWLTFAEMVRVVRSDGFIYLSAPSNGEVHRHPADCWRFYPDAGKALAKWAQHCGHVGLECLESFMLPPLADQWTDFIAVFGRVDSPRRPKEPIVAQFPTARHVHLAR